MKKLFLIRGLPGAGKTEFAEDICDIVISADDYFTDLNGVTNFIPMQLKEAHASCEERTEAVMERGEDVAVANTFTRDWEMKTYFELAEKYGYRVYSIVVENRHGGKSIHDVADSTIKKMRNRFRVKL